MLKVIDDEILIITTLIIVTATINAAMIFLNYDNLCGDLNNFIIKSCISNFIMKLFKKSIFVVRSTR